MHCESIVRKILKRKRRYALNIQKRNDNAKKWMKFARDCTIGVLISSIISSTLVLIGFKHFPNSLSATIPYICGLGGAVAASGVLAIRDKLKADVNVRGCGEKYRDPSKEEDSIILEPRGEEKGKENRTSLNKMTEELGETGGVDHTCSTIENRALEAGRNR